MVAFELRSTEAAQKFISSLKVVKGAASLGSSHSLACQPAKLTHEMCTKEVITFKRSCIKAIIITMYLALGKR